MYKIIFDVMGGDHGPKPAIEAVCKFLKKNPSYHFTLVGDEKQILTHLKTKHSNIEIFHSPNSMPKDIDPIKARGVESSMLDAVKILKDESEGIIISAGNSGAYLTLATLYLKRMDKIKRPAFMPIFPTIVKNKSTLVLDVGANLQATVEYIHQWAQLANAFSKNILGVDKPKVAILNVGEEKNKGMDFHKGAAELLENDSNINYVGFIESKFILTGECDVIVTDGYAGNIALKSAEGTLMAVSKFLKKTFKTRPYYMLGALLSKGVFKKLKNTLNHKKVGGAWILGLSRLAIKAHGSSDKESFLGALNQAKLAIDKDMLNKFKEEL